MAALVIFAAAVAQDVKLGPGDRVRIEATENPSLSVFRSVSTDGFVQIPLVGAINAAGLTYGQLAEAIRAAARIRGIGGEISVRGWFDPSAPVRFAGAVERAGSLPIRPKLKLADVLKLARPLDTADLEAIDVVDAEGRSARFDLASSGERPMRAGDRVHVHLAPIANEVTVVGGVARPGAVTFRSGMTAAMAVQAAGGVSNHGDEGAISVERGGKPLEGSGPLTFLKRGDSVKVGLTAERRYVTIAGAVVKPGLIEFRTGMKLTEALAAAGGLMDNAQRTSIEVKSITTGKSIRVNLDLIQKGQAADPVLGPSDVITVMFTRKAGSL